MRGFHLCELCDANEPVRLISTSGDELLLGSAELWFPSLGGGPVYVAPDLIAHYVRVHGYAPPDEFIATVLATRTVTEWNPEEERRIRVHAGFASNG